MHLHEVLAVRSWLWIYTYCKTQQARAFVSFPPSPAIARKYWGSQLLTVAQTRGKAWAVHTSGSVGMTQAEWAYT